MRQPFCFFISMLFMSIKIVHILSNGRKRNQTNVCRIGMCVCVGDRFQWDLKFQQTTMIEIHQITNDESTKQRLN